MHVNELFRRRRPARQRRAAKARLYVELLEDRNLLSGGPSQPPAIIDVVGHLPVAEYNQFIRDAVNFQGDPFKDWGNEPMIAVDPMNPSQMAISSFAYGNFVTSGPGATRASLWYSTDGGADWGIRFPITENPAPGQQVPNDQTIAYDSSGTLHGAFLTYNVAGLLVSAVPSLNVFQGSTVDPNADGVNGRPADAWQWSPNQVNIYKQGINHADQPWLALGNGAAYVGYGAFDNNGVEFRVSASADNGSTFTADNIINSNGGVSTAENPGIRLATDKVGNVYSIFGWSDTPFSVPQPTHYRLNMSSDGGQTWKFTKVGPKYGGLVIDDGLSLQPNKFGGVNALLGNITAIAADNAGQHVYTVYGKEDASNVDRIWLAEFHPDGQGGLVERANSVALSVPGQRSALPSVAVTDDGTVFVMYDTFDETQFHVHLATSADQGQTFADQDLYDFTATGIPFPYTGGNRLLGDYQFMTAAGNNVYGTFAARGNVTNQKTGIDTTDKIDPFFFTVNAHGNDTAGSLTVAPSVVPETSGTEQSTAGSLNNSASLPVGMANVMASQASANPSPFFPASQSGAIVPAVPASPPAAPTDGSAGQVPEPSISQLNPVAAMKALDLVFAGEGEVGFSDGLSLAVLGS